MVDENYSDFESDVDYNTVLDDFEGPLDLLLHLINIAKIRIEDVFVSKVTEQFLDYIEYMKTRQGRNVDKESEYLALASQIIYIKSKSLVPAVEYEYADEDYTTYEEDQQDLIEQLKRREFEIIQNQTPKLKDLETLGYYFKEPDSEICKTKVIYRDFTVNRLLEAFAKLMLRTESMRREQEKIKEIPKDIYTVPEKVQFIKATLIEKKEVFFESLFDCFSKSEVITTFQALLEMLKFQYVKAEQPDAFGNIKIMLNPDWDLKDVAENEFDEYD